jgi:DNA polymerase III delta prime subunit
MEIMNHLQDIIMPNKNEILTVLNTHMEEDKMNLLFIGSNNTYKTKLIYLLVDEYYKKKNIYHYNHLIMIIDCFIDITFSNSMNEIKTFCKTNTTNKKMIIIDNFDIINEANQQYLKTWMDNCKNTFFLFGCENTNKINEIIQTRISPIYLDDLTSDNYKELVEVISKKEGIIIENVDDLLKYKNVTIHFIYNLFYKLKLLNKKHVEDIIPYITLINYRTFDDYFEIIKTDTKGAIQLLFDLYDKGYSLIDIYHFMYEYIKTINHPNKYTIIEKLCYYIQYIYEGFDNKIMLVFFTNEL